MTALLLITDALSANRVINNDAHPFVGLMRYKGDISCAVFVVKHGVAVTAKHCFEHYGINEDNFEAKELSMSFPKAGGNVDFLNTLVEGDDVHRLILDRGQNDIAYIIYKRETTLEEFKLNEFKVNDYAEIEEGTEVFRAGFPMGHNTVFDKVITSGCTFTGDTGHFDSMVMDKGYEGLLFDTNCPAWFGDSGGPVFSTGTDENGQNIVIIHGVLSHTFEVNFLGEIEESSIHEDDIGKYVRTSMFSPFFLASDLKLAQEIEGEYYDSRQEVEVVSEVVEEAVPQSQQINVVKQDIPHKDIPLSLEAFLKFLFGFILKLFRF
ncbi:MAG: trypsin-like peptidase domain-containing protein [Bacteriovoracaceae bacterium]